MRFKWKLISLLLAFLMATFCMVACVSDDESDSTHKHSYVSGKCSCGAKDPNYKPPHVHNYAGGKCSCGAEDPNYVAPCTHTPAAATRENVVEATCTATGSYEEVIKCLLCGEEISRTSKVIEKLDHTPAEATRENVVEATCTATGSYEEVIKCSVCGVELSREDKIIEKAAHTPAAATKENEIPATCTSAGSYEEVIKCVDCDVEISRVTKGELMLEHKYSRGECSVCGAADPFYTANHSHSFVDGICTGCGLTDPKYEPDYGGATVYAPGSEVVFISDEFTESVYGLIDELDGMLKYHGNGGAVVGNIYFPNQKYEILFNLKEADDSRPLIEKAKQMLERIERDSIFESRYVVYAENGSIAVAFDENPYTNLQATDFIVEIILEKFVRGKEYIAVPAGVIESGSIDLIAIQEELDEESVRQQWTKLEELLGAEITAGIKKIYSMYDDKMVGWAANLYDPGIGGFYTCRTGRNGEEFGPDVECTVQILRFITGSGMLDNLSGGLAVNIPEKMQQQMIYFAKSLQDPTNGYFYHPQWGKAETDKRLSRRGRDLGWATNLLEMFGSRPAYAAPNGKAGDGMTADEYWDYLVRNGLDLGPKPYPCTESPTEESLLGGYSMLTSSLGADKSESVAVLVSSSGDSSTSYLKSHTEFINYLLTTVGPQMDSSPYSGGNNLNATYSQIASYSTKNGIYTYVEGDEAVCTDVELAVSQYKVNNDEDPTNDITIADIYKLFDGMEFKEMLISFLNEKINPEIGLWGKTTASNPTGTEFLFTNGFFKTITIYNSWKMAYPAEYIDDAADALLTGLLGSQPSTGNVCEVYNIWSAVGSLKSNLNYLDESIIATDGFGEIVYDDAGNPMPLKTYIKNQVNNILYTQAKDALINTYNKISAYKMADGGFDHAVKRTPGGYTTQQGLPTGYAEAGQSNIDATCIATTGLVSTIYTAFGVSSAYQVQIFTEADWMRMLDIFLNLDPVIKYSAEESVPIDPIITFENDYSAALKVTTNDNFKNLNTWEVVKVNGDDKLFINKDGKDTSNVTYNGGTVLTLKVTEKEKNAKYLVCEFDVRFENVVGFDSQITINHTSGTGKANSPFLFGLPKNMYNQDVHVVIVYQVTETDEQGNPTAFEAICQYNDKTATVMTETYKTATNILSGKTPLPKVSAINEIVIALNNSFLGDAYFDNLRLAQTSEFPEGINYPTDTPDTPTPEEPKPDPVIEPVVGFDNDYTGAIKISTNAEYGKDNKWTVVTTDGNKELFIDKNSKDTESGKYLGGVAINLKVTDREDGAKYAVCEFDVRFENMVSFASQITINHKNGTKELIGKANSPILFGLPQKPYNVTRHVVIIYEVTAVDAEGNPTAFKATMLVDGVLFDETTELHKDATNLKNGTTALPKIENISSINIDLNNGFLGDAYFDNMSLKLLIELSEFEVPTPDEPEHTHNFVDGKCECGESDPNYVAPEPEKEPVVTFDKDYSSILKVSVNDYFKETNTWTVVEVDGDKKLLVNKTEKDTRPNSFLSGVVLTLGVTDREENAKYMVCEFDLRYENITAIDSQITINHGSYKGKENSPFLFNLPKDKIGINRHIVIVYEVTQTDENGIPSAMKATYIIDGEVNLEYTEVYKTGTNVINGKTPIASVADITEILIALNNSFIGDAYFDNLSLKLLIELPEFEAPTPDEPEHIHNFVDGRCECGESDPNYVAPEPEKEPVVTFDSDYTGVLNIATNAEYGKENTWTVVTTNGNKELFIDKNSKDTESGRYLGGVSMNLKVTDREEGAKYAVCEFDIRLENVVSFASQITINHKNGTKELIGKANSPILFGLPQKPYNVTRHVVIIYEVTAVDAEGNPTAFKATMLVDGVLFDETAELHKDATNLKNGTTALPKIENISSIDIALNNGFLGDAYFDNMSLKLLAELPEFEVPTPDAPEHTHNFVDGKCECGESDPNYVAPEPEKEPVITFDKDYSESLKISNNPHIAPLNSWQVVTVGEEKMLFINKCDSDTSGVTFNGGIASRLSVTYREENAKYMVFELDIYLLNVKSTASQITLGHSGMQYKQNSPFLFTLPKDYKEGEKLHIAITYEVTETDENGVPTAFKAMYIINGKVYDETTTLHKDATNIANGSTKLPTIDQIDHISFDLNNGCKAEAYIDNMSLKLLAELPRLIEPHTHNFVEGKCDCGEEDPDYEAPHEHNYIDGKCECGAEDPGYVAPCEHEYAEGICTKCGGADPDYEAPHEHNYIDGKCECGAEDPGYTPENPGDGNNATGKIPNLDEGGWSKT